MENQELTVRQEVGIFNPPEVVLSNAMIAAKALQSVIANKPDPVIMNGQQYLEFDDWQLCGQFYGYSVKTGDAVPVEVDGVKGAKAHADLINVKTGEVVGGAEAYCMRDEPKWNTRAKYEWQGEGHDRKKVKVADEVVPWFQLASMSQTRAGAKAFRNRLAWVVVLAGYRPTPAEEIADMITEKQSDAGHYCGVHKTAFFKKGKMKSYAHPIGDTGEWCHEAFDDQKSPTELSPVPASTPAKQQPVSPKAPSKTETFVAAYHAAEEEDADGEAMARRHTGGQKLPASLKEVADRLVCLTKDGTWTEPRAIQEIEKLGGVGADTYHKLLSLTPDKLQELNKVIENARNENIPYREDLWK